MLFLCHLPARRSAAKMGVQSYSPAAGHQPLFNLAPGHHSTMKAELRPSRQHGSGNTSRHKSIKCSSAGYSSIDKFTQTLYSKKYDVALRHWTGQAPELGLTIDVQNGRPWCIHTRGMLGVGNRAFISPRETTFGRISGFEYQIAEMQSASNFFLG